MKISKSNIAEITKTNITFPSKQDNCFYSNYTQLNKIKLLK